MFSRKHEINTGIFKLESFLEGLRSILEGNNKRSVSCLDVLTHFSKESLVNFSDHIGRNLAQIATINKDYGVVWSLTQHSPKYMQKNDKKNRSLFCKTQRKNKENFRKNQQKPYNNSERGSCASSVLSGSSSAHIFSRLHPEHQKQTLHPKNL